MRTAIQLPMKSLVTVALDMMCLLPFIRWRGLLGPDLAGGIWRQTVMRHLAAGVTPADEIERLGGLGSAGTCGR